MTHHRDASDTSQTAPFDAIDRWENEGGAPMSESLVARIATLAPAEIEVLQCLGAAVLFEWNDLPTEIQRTLFRHASSDDGTGGEGDLPLRIARFLHVHKDDDASR